MKCPNCGCKLPRKALFCGSCGTKLEISDSNYKAPKKTNIKVFVIIGGVAVVILTSVIILLALHFAKTNDNHSVNQTNHTKEISESEKAVSPDQFLAEQLLQDYDAYSDEVAVSYTIDLEENSLTFDCEEFNDIFLGYITGDLNNDGNSDIIAYTLEEINKDFEKDGDYNYICICERPYVYDSGTFAALPYSSFDMFAPYLSVSQYTTIKNTYALMQCNGKTVKAYSNTIFDDTSVYSESYPPYYSPENSLGDLNSSLDIQEYNGDFFETKLSLQELVSHIKCMPEAEKITYIDHMKKQDLFCKGVTSVTTSSDNPAPEFKYEDSGVYSNEEDALAEINECLKSNDLSAYCLKPFLWEEKDNNLLMLKEYGPHSLSITYKGENIDDHSRRCYITVEQHQ